MRHAMQFAALLPVRPVTFLGQVLISAGEAFTGRWQFRLKDLGRITADCSGRAVPIVTVVNVLVGAQTPSTDLRGFTWFGQSSVFTGFNAPNSTLPDVLTSTGYCNSGGQNPPCTVFSGAGGLSGNDVYTGLGPMNVARSRHAGGVNAGMCDGSVKFFKNSINLFTWQSLSSSKGGEIVSSDAY